MGDETINEVVNEFEDLASANGVAREQLRPIVDAVVNRLRLDLSDREILFMLTDDDVS